MINNINLNLYKVFYICARCNSFVEASKKLCVSQPAISKQIKNLESLIETKLFYRTNNGLVLTSDGKKLYDYIEKSYNYLMAGEKIIKENNTINAGTIIIGAPSHITKFYLLDFIEQYRKKYPNVFFRIINGSTSELLKGLEEHTIDFIVDSSPINTNNKIITVLPLKTFETCFVTTNVNAKRKYIVPTVRSSMRKNLEKELEKNNIKLDIVLEVETTDLIISSVKQNIGIGYVIKQAVKDELKNKELYELKTKYNLPKLEINLVYISDYLTKLANHFLKKCIIESKK